MQPSGQRMACRKNNKNQNRPELRGIAMCLGRQSRTERKNPQMTTMIASIMLRWRKDANAGGKALSFFIVVLCKALLRVFQISWDAVIAQLSQHRPYCLPSFFLFLDVQSPVLVNPSYDGRGHCLNFPVIPLCAASVMGQPLISCSSNLLSSCNVSD